MKRLLLVVISIFLAAVFSGCSVIQNILPGHATDAQTTASPVEESSSVPVETEISLPVVEGDAVVYGNKLTGLTAEEIRTALNSYLERYSLSVTLDDTVFSLGAADLGIFLNADLDLDDAVLRLNSGELTAEELQQSVFTFETEQFVMTSMLAGYENRLLELVNAAAGESGSTELSEEEIQEVKKKIDGIVNASSARIVYVEEECRFVGVDGKPGEVNDYSAAAKLVYEAALSFAANVSCNSEILYSGGEPASESSEIQSALNRANRYLDLKIVYHFNVPDGEAKTVTMGRKTIGSWIFVDSSGRDIYVDTDVMKQYAYTLSQRYDDVVKTETRERDGEDVMVTIKKVGYRLHDEEIYADLYSCISEKKSGEFTATYYRLNKTTVMKEDAETYVYINLTKQKAYLYVDGKVDYSTSIVSGNVAEGHRTRTGTFYIYSKDTERYLTGATYRSYVHYFMPFNGGVGLHDADGWRSSYGGNIYLRNGSHGCINMPYSAAKYFFQHVEIGTKVVVVGGARSVDDRTQSLKVTPSTVRLQAGQTQQLSMSASGKPTYTYECDNPDVCTVSESGLITAVGKGNAKITVRAVAEGYTEGVDHVTVRVSRAAQKLLSAQTNLKLTAGSTKQLKVSALGGATLSYRSNNKNVCIVSAEGAIEARSAGTAVITVKAAATDAYEAAELQITVEVIAASTQPSTEPSTAESSTDSSEAETTQSESEETTAPRTDPVESTSSETDPHESSPEESSSVGESTQSGEVD